MLHVAKATKAGSLHAPFACLLGQEFKRQIFCRLAWPFLAFGDGTKHFSRGLGERPGVVWEGNRPLRAVQLRALKIILGSCGVPLSCLVFFVASLPSDLFVSDPDILSFCVGSSYLIHGDPWPSRGSPVARLKRARRCAPRSSS